jgi:translation initiation factor 3 subunit J
LRSGKPILIGNQVADNWEEEEDSEVEREKAKKAAEVKAKADALAAASKKSKSQRIEEHREEQRRRRLAAEEDGESSEEETEAAKRARIRATEQEADLKHAEALLGDIQLGGKKTAGPNKAFIIEDKSNPGHAINLDNISLFKPSTKTQFDQLTVTLGPLLSQSATKPHYSLWVQNFVKQICAELPSAEIKKAASGLTALSNEKMKEEKERDRTGKKKTTKAKPTAAVGRDVGAGRADLNDYGGDDGLGDDDFM